MKVKICGMRESENISAVAELEPDYMGFIFYPKSRRFFSGDIPPIHPDIVKTGVFVNEEAQLVEEIVNKYQLMAVQLHGDETVSYCRDLKQKLNRSVELVKAFAMHLNFDMAVLRKYQEVCDYFLFDTKGEQRGGTGKVFDWKVLDSYNLNHPFFLSGGIGLDQLEALKEFFNSQAAENCVAVDVNSQFEDRPGIKRVADLQRFVSQVKSFKDNK